MPLRGAAQNLKQCQNCYKSYSKETPLLSCSQCKRAHYCSPECQAADWKNHKITCKQNRDTRDLMKEDSHTSRPFDGAEVEARMKKWVQYFRPVLYAAATHALKIQTSPQSWRTQAVYIRLSPAFDLQTGIPNNESQLPHAFKLEEAYVFPISELVEIRPEFDLPIRSALSRSSTPSSQEFGAVDIMIVILIVPEISVVRLLPLGMYGKDVDLPPWDPHWKGRLGNALKQGILL